MLVPGDFDDVGVVHWDLEQFRQLHDLLLAAPRGVSVELLALLLRLCPCPFRLGEFLAEAGHCERVVVRVVVRNVEGASLATQLLAKLLLFELPLSYAFLSRTGGSGRHCGFFEFVFDCFLSIFFNLIILDLLVSPVIFGFK